MSKGILYNLISRLIFIIGAYSIHIYLARYLGPKKYGVFGVCIGIVTIGYIFFNNGIRQVVSKSTTKFPDSAKYFLLKGISIQLPFALLFGLTIIILSENIALFFHDMNLAKPLCLSGVIIITQSLFFVYVGVLNGLKKFGQENAVLCTYGFIRAFTAILLVYLGMEIMGALSGFLIASIIAIVLGLILTRKLSNKKHTTIGICKMVKSMIPIIIIFGGITIIMNLDLLAVKYYINDARFSGYYTSAAAISKVICWILFPFAYVIFPFISSSFHKKNIKQTKKYIQQVIRYALLMIAPITLIFFIYSKNIVHLIYGSNYEISGSVLKILVWGLMGLGFVSIFSHIMIAIDKLNIMVLYTLFGITISILLNLILVPNAGLTGASISTTISAGFIAIVTFTYIKRTLKIMIKLQSILKIISTLSIIFFMSFLIDKISINFILKGAILYLIYFFILLLLKEINRDDVNVIKNLINHYSRNNTALYSKHHY